ncbi:MAG: thioredoxin family protein [Chloroflexi bacterium]|nr:thioredoxin family protein [Chloroflexota bacterium]
MKGNIVSNLNIGDNAISFSLPGVDDQTHALSDHADKNAIAVIFSCNHCPYVRAWEDRMVQIQADYAAKGAQLIAINANDAAKYPDDSFPKMKERAQEKGFNFPYLHDESQEIARAYGAERTPEIFLFDKDGKLRYHGAIDDNYEMPEAVKAPYLRDALDAVLSGETPETAETPPVGCSVKWKA